MRLAGALIGGLLLLASPATARLIVENANGYTLGADGAMQRFATLVVDDAGKVEATLAAGAAVERRRGDARLDAKGRTLLPGMIDAHGHIMGLGQSLRSVDLTTTNSLAEAQGRIRVFARKQPRSAWVLDGGWNQERWSLGRYPTAAELDAAVADRPAWLARVDGHAGWANSRALALAGVTAATADPPGGRIERDAQGRPTGVLVDNAMALVEKIVPPATPAERERRLDTALAALAAVGLTGVHDAGTDAATCGLYRKRAAAGRLSLRIYAMIGGPEEVAGCAPNGPEGWLADDRLAVRAVKLYADGALGSRGAWLRAPYSDAPDQTGLKLRDEGGLRGTVVELASKGFQPAVHAIGDAANGAVLGAFAALPDDQRAAVRPRIEHAQVLALDDLPRFERLKVIASVQPTHATSDKTMAEARVGPERLAGAYAWRALLGSGARLAGGSDFPVEPPNPFFGLHAAVTRQDRAGQPPGGWRMGEALTLTEALAAFTTGAAYAGFAEDKVGTLTIGKWADFILVDRDIFATPPAELWRTTVDETWLAGRRVYRKR